MKTKYVFVALVLSVALGFSQPHSDFEDGTLQNWTNTDGTIDTMSVQGTSGTMYLEKICDGSNSPTGEMAIINRVDYVGNYDCDDPQGIDCWGGLDVIVRNSNSFDMYLRYGFKNSNGETVVSDPAIIIPSSLDWNIIELVSGSQLFVVDGTGSVEDVLADVQEIKLIHNQNLTYDGEEVSGNLEIDDVFTIYLLSSEDQLLEKTSIYPNPVKDIFIVQFPNPLDASVDIYNILGEKVMDGIFVSNSAQIDISSLKSGVYMATIKTEVSSVTKKIIKL